MCRVLSRVRLTSLTTLWSTHGGSGTEVPIRLSEEVGYECAESRSTGVSGLKTVGPVGAPRPVLKVSR